MSEGAAIVHGMVIEHDIMVTARDGVPFATDVYRPEGLGPIATRLPTRAIPAAQAAPW